MKKLDGIQELEIWVIARSSEGEWRNDESDDDRKYFKPARIYQQTILLTIDPESRLIHRPQARAQWKLMEVLALMDEQREMIAAGREDEVELGDVDR
jgi:hypothetical protein